MILHDAEAPSFDLEELSYSPPSLHTRTVKSTIRATSNNPRDAESLSVPVDFFDETSPQTPLATDWRANALKEQGVDVVAPDVSDRATLLNLARASWDAYHSTPTPNRWYDIDGMNWVRFSFLYLSNFPLLKSLNCRALSGWLTDYFIL